MREHVTISVESAKITSFFFFSKHHISLFRPNLLAWAFVPSRRSPLSKCSLCRARTGLGNVTEQRTHHSWQMHQLREQLLGWSLTLSSRGCARRGADAAVSKREKCIFPPQKEAVYRPSKKKNLFPCHSKDGWGPTGKMLLRVFAAVPLCQLLYYCVFRAFVLSQLVGQAYLGVLGEYQSMKSSQPPTKHEILHLLAEHKNAVSVGLWKIVLQSPFSALGTSAVKSYKKLLSKTSKLI